MEVKQQLKWRITSKSSKSTKSQSTFQIIRLTQGHSSCTQTTKTAIFTATPMKIHLVVYFTKGDFFVNLLAGKLLTYGFSAKVLPAC